MLRGLSCGGISKEGRLCYTCIVSVCAVDSFAGQSLERRCFLGGDCRRTVSGVAIHVAVFSPGSERRPSTASECPPSMISDPCFSGSIVALRCETQKPNRGLWRQCYDPELVEAARLRGRRLNGGCRNFWRICPLPGVDYIRSKEPPEIAEATNTRKKGYSQACFLHDASNQEQAG